MNTKECRNTTAIGYASLMLVAAWQAIRSDGGEKSPEMLAEIEKRIEDGKATLAISIQRIGGTVRLTAAVLDATDFQNPFDHLILDLTGPLVLSREQLAHVAALKPGDLN